MENQQPTIIGYAEIMQETQRLINSNWLTISGLSLGFALAQYTQGSHITPISAIGDYLLSLVSGLFKLLLVLLVIGGGSISIGLRKIGAVFKMKTADWQQLWKQLVRNIAWNKVTLSVNLIVFMVAMTIANASIALSVHLGMGWLKTEAIITSNVPHWSVVIFLQNLSTVPFTIVFVCLLGLILVGKKALSKK